MTLEAALREWERQCWDEYNHEHYDPIKGCYVMDDEENED